MKGKEFGHQIGFNRGYEEGFKYGQSIDHTRAILKYLNLYTYIYRINLKIFYLIILRLSFLLNRGNAVYICSELFVNLRGLTVFCGVSHLQK